jgi:predicted CXXCH cytochrome family protein
MLRWKLVRRRIAALLQFSSFGFLLLAVFFGIAEPLLGLSRPTITSTKQGTEKSDDGAFVGNRACASCHQSIYDSYEQTPMAHASGPATENLTGADFTHKKSDVHYRVFAADGKAWLTFERPGDPFATGRRELLYSIGSGRRGRTYLFSVDGFFFESPVNWYADSNRWDMAPAYGNAKEIPLNLPVYSECLRCHASGVREPLDGTENRYSQPLFVQNGIGCERCHGPGAAHIKQASAANIVNPIKLSPERRDSICMQCHLEGSVAIERKGKHASDFRAGLVLDDFIRHFVLTEGSSSALAANSQFEALSQSQCKKQSGDAMSCMSCHDPHYSPPAGQRVSYYRAKCVACHGTALAAKHHSGQPDCTSCHMPASLSKDIAHTEVTDHRIRRQPDVSPQLLLEVPSSSSAPKLTPFPESKDAEADVRDRALAWQFLVENGHPEAEREASKDLRLAAESSTDDPATLAGLAYVELRDGKIDQARELYEKVLALDPTFIVAAANLGVIKAKSGDTPGAVGLWQRAFALAPGKSVIGMNLSRAFCAAGQTKEALAMVERVLQFNPDLPEGKKLARSLNANPPRCGM